MNTIVKTQLIKAAAKIGRNYGMEDEDRKNGATEKDREQQ